MSGFKFIFLLPLFFISLHTNARDTVVVAIKHAPPFCIKENGEWSGLTVGIWREVEKDLGVHTEYREMNMDEMTTAVEKSTVDVGLGAVTVSAEREKQFDFSTSFYPSGLGIIFRDEKTTATKIILNLISTSFVKVVGLLCLVLFVVGCLIWMAERRKNGEEFEDGTKGLWSGFWWAAVTMTTVGYGDKAPKSVPGKIIGLVWMFASLIMVSYFTASIASSLTVQRISSQFDDPSDLKRVEVGVIGGTISETYLKKHFISYKKFKNIDALTQGIKNNEIDAAVADFPLLKYHLHTNPMKSIKMLPHKLNDFFYALPLSNDFEYREALNVRMQKYLESEKWREALGEYFGDID